MGWAKLYRLISRRLTDANNGVASFTWFAATRTVTTTPRETDRSDRPPGDLNCRPGRPTLMSNPGLSVFGNNQTITFGK